MTALAPVLLIIFNRADTSQRVFDAIRKQRPTRLYVAADGPRPGVTGEEKRCQETRAIIEQIDWECDLKTRFSPTNQGCAQGVYNAISWFFEHEEEGIILEDDCLPHPDFFEYCTQLLEKYRHDENIALISGDNFVEDLFRNTNASYTLSTASFIWGWASWRRAWKDFYLQKRFTPRQITTNTKKLHFPWKRRIEAQFRNFLFNTNKVDTWDTLWNMFNWERQAYTIIPRVNLISNIGFGGLGVHCTQTDNPRASLPVFPILPLAHPLALKYDPTIDNVFYERFERKSLLRYLFSTCRYHFFVKKKGYRA